MKSLRDWFPEERVRCKREELRELLLTLKGQLNPNLEYDCSKDILSWCKCRRCQVAMVICISTFVILGGFSRGADFYKISRRRVTRTPHISIRVSVVEGVKDAERLQRRFLYLDCIREMTSVSVKMISFVSRCLSWSFVMISKIHSLLLMICYIASMYQSLMVCD